MNHGGPCGQNALLYFPLESIVIHPKPKAKAHGLYGPISELQACFVASRVFPCLQKLWRDDHLMCSQITLKHQSPPQNIPCLLSASAHQKELSQDFVQGILPHHAFVFGEFLPCFVRNFSEHSLPIHHHLLPSVPIHRRARTQRSPSVFDRSPTQLISFASFSLCLGT